MDWKVNVVLPSGQVTTVTVCGYLFPEDAKAAAKAQTGAKEILNFSTITNSSSRS
jgi:hypothetical protein